MHEPRVTEIQDPGPLKEAGKITSLSMAAIVVGALAFGYQMSQSPSLAWVSYLEGYFYALCLGLAGVFFVAVNNVAKSVWSFPIRRICEAMSAYLPWALITIIPVLIFYDKLYVWHDHDAIHLHGTKATYLSFGFWAARLVVYLLIWILFARHFRKSSIAQDTSKQPLTSVLKSAIFLIIFAFTFCLFSIDLLMSLRPHWFSTMYGVYCFAGLFQAGLCVMILTALHLRKNGYLNEGVFRERHLFDMGTWLLAWSTFMVYIGFSQFMLIFYANLPEETTFFIDRFRGNWKYVYILIFFIKWAIPFLVLMPKPARRSPKVLTFMCTLILLVEWLDIFWLASPEFTGKGPFGGHLVVSFLTGMGFLGLFALVFVSALKKHSVVAVGEPKLLSSVNGDYL